MKKFKLVWMMMVVMALCLTVTGAFAAERDTVEKEGKFVVLTAGGTIEAGKLVVVWTNGLAYAAVSTAGYVAVGRAENSAVVTESVKVGRGVYRWANQGSFTDADIGTLAYVWTNGAYSVTTAVIGSTNVVVGRVYEVDTSGVWVDSLRSDK